MIEQEFAKLNQAGIVNLSQLAQRTPEELSALVKPEVLRALAKYFKGGDRTINMVSKKLCTVKSPRRNTKDSELQSPFDLSCKF